MQLPNPISIVDEGEAGKDLVFLETCTWDDEPVNDTSLLRCTRV